MEINNRKNLNIKWLYKLSFDSFKEDLNWGKDWEDLTWCGREFQRDEAEGTKEFKVEEVLQ